MAKERTYTAEQLQAAYVEGFDAGESHGNIDWKYLPLPLAFVMSDTRKLLGPRLRSQEELAEAWHAAKITEQEDLVPEWDEVKVV